MESSLDDLDRLLSQLRWFEISLTPDVRKGAARSISRYNLRAHDAVHRASATYLSVRDFAALDEVYRRVDGLILWNDLIHAGKPIRGYTNSA